MAHDCFSAITAEFSSCGSDAKAHKIQDVYCLALYKKYLLTFGKQQPVATQTQLQQALKKKQKPSYVLPFVY